MWKKGEKRIVGLERHPGELKLEGEGK